MAQIKYGAYVTHPTYYPGIRLWVNDINDEETEAECHPIGHDVHEWLPISELTLVKHPPSGFVPPGGIDL